MADVKLSFARKKDDGRLVDVDEVPNGLRCNCVCPDPSCANDLMAVQGEERQHHFRHKGDSDAKCKGEKYGIYGIAKDIIRERKKLSLPLYRHSISAKDSKGIDYLEDEVIIQKGADTHFDSISFHEEDIDGMRLSLHAIKEDAEFLLEVELPKSIDLLNKESLWSYINNPQHVRICGYKNENLDRKLREQINEKIKLHEYAYDKEEIEKERLRKEERQKLDEDIRRKDVNRNYISPISYSPPKQSPPPSFSGADYLSNLNDTQKQAVETTEGAVLVLAGAGTGKTRVLTTRLAHLLRTSRAYPGQILAVTFTNKAAQEMKHRVSALMGGAPVEGWWLGTFHSLCARMLRRHAELVGLTSSFTILDQDDQTRLIKQLMEAEGLDTKKWPAKAMADKISSWKDKGLLPHEVGSYDVGDYAGGKLQSIYAQYQARLKTLNACDFGDLLLHMITILKDPKHADVQADYHRRFKYILVDEYQDTNVAQYLWLRLLAKGSGNICCVGDDDQSIYGWRGAEVDNILRFEKDFPGAVVIRLEENYRSRGHILNCANNVISNNEKRLGKKLYTNAGDGEKVRVRGLWDAESEVRWVSQEIESMQLQGDIDLDQIAILVRASFQMRGFEERFTKIGLPYRVIGGPRFYERHEIRDALAYLRVVNQSQDDLALARIINTPKRGIGDSTLQILHSHARKKGISLYNAMQDLTQTEDLKPKVRTTIFNLFKSFERWKSLLNNTHHSELAGIILDESDYTSMWQADKSPDAPGRLENLKELVSSMEQFESLAEFLESVALVMDNQQDNSTQKISLMTLHAAKGLEFECVFLPGWEEGLFPSQRTMEEGLTGVEEERRIAHVGITRARRKLYISHVANRQIHGSWVNAIPSRFVDELPEEDIEVESDLGLHGNAGRSAHWDSSGTVETAFVRKTSFIGGVSSRVSTKADNLSGAEYQRGDLVMHQKFGQGKVIHVDGGKLDIAFETGGTKRVLDSFIKKV